jgi:hypothetical protein
MALLGQRSGQNATNAEHIGEVLQDTGSRRVMRARILEIYNKYGDYIVLIFAFSK